MITGIEKMITYELSSSQRFFNEGKMQTALKRFLPYMAGNKVQNF
jgi:hypothetical protein